METDVIHLPVIMSQLLHACGMSLQALLSKLEDKAKPFLNRSIKDIDSQVKFRRAICAPCHPATFLKKGPWGVPA